MIVLQCIRVLEWAIYWPSFYDVIMRDWRASRGFWLYLFTTIKRYCSSARRPSQRKMYAKQAGGSGDRFGAHRNCYSAREGEIWLRHVCRTFCAYSHHRKAAFCTPKQEERLLIRFCRTDAYIYSTVGISTKISHQPLTRIILFREDIFHRHHDGSISYLLPSPTP